jgi:hypothetical protein
MNENRLSRVVFNNNSCRLYGPHTQRGLAFAWRQSRTRKRSRCQGSGGGLGYLHRIGFLEHGHPIACSARATSVSLCARPVSLCMAAAAAARVICACVRRESVCVRALATISREQGPNKLTKVEYFATRMQLLDILDCCRITHSCTHTSDV